jgi:hypothetical protein
MSNLLFFKAINDNDMESFKEILNDPNFDPSTSDNIAVFRATENQNF